MRADEHVRRLLTQSDQIPTGAFERAILHSATGLSDALGDEDLGYRSRLRLSAWAAASGDTTERLRAFDWCLERHLADPIRFPAAADDLDLLWDFASIPRLLAGDPRYSTEAIEECLDEMLRVYSNRGVDLGGYWLARFECAVACGDDAGARVARATLSGAHPADSPLCEACLMSVELQWHVDNERFERAIACYDLLLARGVGCADEPERAHSRVVLPLLMTGRTARAREIVSAALVGARRNPKNVAALADYLTATVLLGELSLAVDLVRRHLHWIVYDPLGLDARFAFLTATGAALNALVRAGRGETSVPLVEADRLHTALGAHLGSWTAKALAERCWSVAGTIASSFDARNGTSRYAERLRAARSLVPLVDGMPAAAGGLPAFFGGDRAMTVLSRPGMPAIAGQSMPRDLTSADLLDRARESASAGAVTEAFALIDQALPRAAPLTRAELFALRIRILVEGENAEEAEQVLSQRIDCLILDDLDDEAEVDLQLGLLIHGATAPDRESTLEAALARTRELGLRGAARMRVVIALAGLRFQQRHFGIAQSLLEDELQRSAGEIYRREPALSLLADVYCALGRSADAVDILDRVLASPIDRAMRASMLLRRSTLLVALDRDAHSVGERSVLFDHALDDADRSLGLYSEINHAEGILDACGVLAELLGRAGVITGAIEALRTAAHTATRIEHPDAPSIRFRLARALVRSDRGDQAREIIDSVLEEESVRTEGWSDAEPAEFAVVLHWFGHACRQDDDDPAAYCAWSVALEHFARAGDDLAAVEVGISLGRLLFDNDEESSIEVLAHAVATARRLATAEAGGSAAGGGGVRSRSATRASAMTLLVDALHLLGRAQAAFDRTEGLDTLDVAREHAARAGFGDPAFLASILESRARALDDLGDEHAAALVAREAAEAYRACGDEQAARDVDLFETRLLALTAGADRLVPDRAAPLGR
ncbi:MAG: hypothetical protein EPO52_02970 [Herbiconiux sp.]|uniref:hypothetical protein n=1 Tax=Herbiconiux sp. TaxID=1871186 RepID=UPI00122518AD|nr:hypothetical protein [Herbiconiux sp.]TAJ49908.1 MAG: hypothetical protein EPO52_02970 [Herbiconiux sp.]